MISALIVLYVCGVYPLLPGTMGKHVLKDKVKMLAYVLGREFLPWGARCSIPTVS